MEQNSQLAVGVPALRTGRTVTNVHLHTCINIRFVQTLFDQMSTFIHYELRVLNSKCYQSVVMARMVPLLSSSPLADTLHQCFSIIQVLCEVKKGILIFNDL